MRKIYALKNILKIVIMLLVIINMSKSCTKAYTFSDFSNFVDQVQGQSTNSSYVNEIVNVFKGSKNAILTLFANNNKSLSNYNYFAIARARSSAIYTFYVATNDIVTFIPSGNYGPLKYDPYGLDVRLTYENGNWVARFVRTSNDWISNQGTSAFIGLNNTANYGGNKDWTYSGYNKVYWWVVGDYNPITYLQYNTAITENTHNGSLFTYYYQGNLYGQNEIKLGNITINDSYYYEVRLRNSNTNVVIGTIFYDVNTNNTYNDGAIYQDNNKNIYVTTRLINYSTQYQLEVESYYGDGGTNLYEDIDWYIFLPTNAIISGDSIQDFGNGEFTTQDSTNAIIDSFNNTIESGNKEVINNINDSSEVESIMNETFSGDIETISSDLGFSALDNPFTSFLFFVIEGVYDVLTEREDIVLSTHYKSLEFNLASTDFTIPQNELKTFIRNMLVCVYIYGNYKWFHYMITLLETARINKFMAEIGTDEFYDTDIM